MGREYSITVAVWLGGAGSGVPAERQAAAACLPLAYAVFAVIFALVRFEPRDEFWPLPFVEMALVLYATAHLLKRPASAWAQTLRSSGLAIALFAPNIGYGLLAFRVGEAADIGRTYVISEPLLYLWSMGAAAIFGLVLAIEAWRRRSMAVGYASSVILLVALLLASATSGPRTRRPTCCRSDSISALLFDPRRVRVPGEFRELVGVAEVAAAALLLGTTFIQTFDDGTTYRFVLLGESIAYLATGLLLRRRLMVVPALAFAAVAGALFAFERQAGGGLPPWAILGLVGGFLIGVGFLFLMRRDIWERAQRAVLGWWTAWEA